MTSASRRAGGLRNNLRGSSLASVVPRRPSMPMFRRSVLVPCLSRAGGCGCLVLLLGCGNALAVTVDGHIDPAEWQGAQHITDFRKVQPLNGEPASVPTEAWVLATPEGLAIAFRNTQPAGVPRTHQRIRRDEQAQLDRVNLMIDFDGDGRTGYNFMVTLSDDINDAVITNESQFQHRLGRQLAARGQRGRRGLERGDADPLVHRADAQGQRRQAHRGPVPGSRDRLHRRARRLAAGELHPAALPVRFRAGRRCRPTASRCSRSRPMWSGVRDQVQRAATSGEGGADIFWKPNGQTQLTATINPDFGQVESDDLVVNFGADETFFSDKRPFFTENQGIFDFSLLLGQQPADLHATRRRPADDGNGAADITGAVKLNGSVGATQYGVFGGAGERRRRAHLRRAAADPRFRHADARPAGHAGRAAVSGPRRQRARHRSPLAAERASSP